MGVVEIGGDSHNSVFDFLSGVGLSNLFHFNKDHGRDLLRCILFSLPIDIWNTDVGSAFLVDDVIGQVLLVVLHGFVSVSSSDESLDIIDGSGGVNSGLVLGGFSNESLLVSEGHDRGGDSVTEFVGDDFNLAILENAHTRVGGAQVDTDDGTLVLLVLGDGQDQ